MSLKQASPTSLWKSSHQYSNAAKRAATKTTLTRTHRTPPSVRPLETKRSPTRMVALKRHRRRGTVLSI
ncbi:hypothetical protein GHK30_32320 [Sinorhizobium medicae]|nr:hypothetical protein [Sinorhizobium medicae]